MADLQRFRNVVAGQERAAVSGRWFPSATSFTEENWAELPYCGPDDAGAAVEVAQAAFTKVTWPALTAMACGKLPWRLGDLIACDADKLAAIEVRDNGKLLAEMGSQLRHPPERYHCFGGLADKIRGSVLPRDKSAMFTYTPARVRRLHRQPRKPGLLPRRRGAGARLEVPGCDGRASAAGRGVERTFRPDGNGTGLDPSRDRGRPGSPGTGPRCFPVGRPQGRRAGRAPDAGNP